jgi:hypothetical protein
MLTSCPWPWVWHAPMPWNCGRPHKLKLQQRKHACKACQQQQEHKQDVAKHAAKHLVLWGTGRAAQHTKQASHTGAKCATEP